MPVFKAYCDNFRGEQGPTYYPKSVLESVENETAKLLASLVKDADKERTEDTPNSRKLTGFTVTIYNPIESVLPSGPVNISVTPPANLFVSDAELLELDSKIRVIGENLIRRSTICTKSQDGLYEALRADVKAAEAAAKENSADAVVAKYEGITEEELAALNQALAKGKLKVAPKSTGGPAIG